MKKTLSLFLAMLMLLSVFVVSSFAATAPEVPFEENIAAVYALHQRLPNDSYLFNGDSDVIYYRTVAEAIEGKYPESHYLPILRSQIARMTAQSSLLSQAKQVNFPEIKMPNMYGQEVALSSLSGKVILLHFWSAAIGNGNTVVFG